MTLILSPDTRHTTGAILLTIVAIEYGGWFMLRIVQGHQPATLVSTLFISIMYNMLAQLHNWYLLCLGPLPTCDLRLAPSWLPLSQATFDPSMALTRFDLSQFLSPFSLKPQATSFFCTSRYNEIMRLMLLQVFQHSSSADLIIGDRDAPEF
ncbi:MAG: hypothetical protein E6J34_15010 [Chloroflexi bacterium]|nr:MAG: hypothetical protein E6J34_15010 [Chloroflexota bacterium]